MKINRLRINRETLTYDRSRYARGPGNVITEGNSTTLVIDSDVDLSGCMAQTRTGPESNRTSIATVNR
jgi:hypothetical protein